MTLSRAYLGLIAGVLLGYAFLDKGFAFLPYSPIFVGELALLASIFALGFGAVSASVFRTPISWAILVFAAWELVVALPDVGTFGLLSYRDSTIWIYAIFALTVGGAIIRADLQSPTLDWFGRWFPWFLVWAPIAFLASVIFQGSIPFIPGSSIPILLVKPGDLSVHLGGAAAFMLLGLHKLHPFPRARYVDFVLWMAWAAAFIVMASKTRGGALAIISSLILVYIFRRPKQTSRLLTGLISLVAIGLIVLPLAPIVTGGGRTVTVGQVFENVVSIVARDSGSDLEGTVEWRIGWWSEIVGYTVFGDHFWTGKGFGINLADSDGFQVADGHKRSPHNGHLTILARSGLPGLFLWIMFLVTFYVSMIAGRSRARRSHQDHLANTYIWILAYVTGSLANMSFDVYLEGPQGSIWFWSMIGFGISLTSLQRRQTAKHYGSEPATPSAHAMSLRPKLYFGDRQ